MWARFGWAHTVLAQSRLASKHSRQHWWQALSARVWLPRLQLSHWPKPMHPSLRVFAVQLCLYFLGFLDRYLWSLVRFEQTMCLSIRRVLNQITRSHSHLSYRVHRTERQASPILAVAKMPLHAIVAHLVVTYVGLTNQTPSFESANPAAHDTQRPILHKAQILNISHAPAAHPDHRLGHSQGLIANRPGVFAHGCRRNVYLDRPKNHVHSHTRLAFWRLQVITKNEHCIDNQPTDYQRTHQARIHPKSIHRIAMTNWALAWLDNWVLLVGRASNLWAESEIRHLD